LSVVGIVTALAAEARAFPIAERPRGTMRRLADGSLLIVGGIGPAAAAVAARSVLAAGATALASWGFAGGLDPALRAGTILLPGEVISAAGATYATSDAWRRSPAMPRRRKAGCSAPRRRSTMSPENRRRFATPAPRRSTWRVWPSPRSRPRKDCPSSRLA
jgi:nucleoside phosphorylase